MGKGLRDRFQSSVRRGTGEAVLLLKQHPKFSADDFIVKACAQNFAYDPQCEESRAEYAIFLIQNSGRAEDLAAKVLGRLRRSRSESSWNTVHLLRVCGLLHSLGMVDARSAAFDFYRGFSAPLQDHGESDALIEFFGQEGLLVAARAVGGVLLRAPETWADDRLLRLFSEQHPTTDPEELLSTYVPRDKAIVAYLDKVKVIRTSEKKLSTGLVRNLAYYRALIDSQKHVSPIGPFAKLDRKLFDALFADFRRESDGVRSMRLVQLLQRHRITGGKEKLLELVKYERGPQLDAICTALSHFKDGRIRNLAIKGIKSGRYVTEWLDLLEKNYEQGDADLVVKSLGKLRTTEMTHRFIGPVERIYMRNSGTECQRPLELLYDRTNCGLCRKDLVRLLWRSKCLNDQIRSEILYDSYDETRKLGSRIRGIKE